MGAQGSKAGGQMSAAAVQARRAAVAQAAQAEARAAAEAAAAAEGAAVAGREEGQQGPQPPASMPPVPAARAQAAVAPAQALGGSALLETDAALIKAMNELGPAIKTMRLETPRQAQNPMVQAHDERAHTVPEETLAKILKGRRETPQGFSVALACEKHGLKPEELAQALKVLEMPRIVERQGQKFGYWN